MGDDSSVRQTINISFRVSQTEVIIGRFSYLPVSCLGLRGQEIVSNQITSSTIIAHGNVYIEEVTAWYNTRELNFGGIEQRCSVKRFINKWVAFWGPGKVMDLDCHLTPLTGGVTNFRSVQHVKVESYQLFVAPSLCKRIFKEAG
ncbi:hypothetical protein J6590_093377, partial [Homalodisca vitripennis]